MNSAPILHGREIKGEVAVLVAGRKAAEEQEERPHLAEEIRLLEAEGFSLKEIVQMVGERRGIPKREIYALGVRLREGEEE